MCSSNVVTLALSASKERVAQRTWHSSQGSQYTVLQAIPGGGSSVGFQPSVRDRCCGVRAAHGKRFEQARAGYCGALLELRLAVGNRRWDLARLRQFGALLGFGQQRIQSTLDAVGVSELVLD